MTLLVGVVRSLTLAERADWDMMVAESDLPSPFLRSWWLDAVAVPERRFVVVVTPGGALVGGAALERRHAWGTTRWTMAGSGTLCPDHLDIVARPLDVTTVATAVAEVLTETRSWVLDLDGLREGSWLARALRTAGHAVDEEVVERAPYVALPATYEEYLAGRSKNFTRKARKLSRRAAENGMVVRRARVDELTWALDRFEDLNEARGDRAELLAEMPRVRAMVAAGFAADEVVVHVTEQHDEVVAMALTVTSMGMTRNYQTVRALHRGNDGTAMITHLAVIEAACAAGHSEMDFLRGAEPYKYDYADHERGVVRLRTGGGAGRVALLARRRAALVKRLMRRVGKKLSTSWIRKRPAAH